ncbi:MAG: hypothetical protein OIF40_08025 [Mangrovicoccus sp.]|nr:hypothetical protein [Mangrovicoccus sp.]
MSDAVTTPALPSEIILVLGMHRSGSSALTRALSITGYSLPKTLIKSNVSNRRGHWESQPLARLDDGLLKEAGLVWSDWAVGDLPRLPASTARDFQTDLLALISDEFPHAQPAIIKEPRICRLVPHYRAAFDGQVPFKVVIALRNPLEVIASLVRRNNMSEANAALLWLRYMLDAVAASEGTQRAFIAYDRLLSEPIPAIADLQRDLGGAFPNTLDSVGADIEDFLSDGLRSHAASSEEVVQNDLTQGWISDAYAALRVLTRDPNAPEALESLSRIKREFDAASPVLAQILSQYDLTLDELRRGNAALEAALELKNEHLALLREAAATGDLNAPAQRETAATAATPKKKKKGLKKLLNWSKAAG